METKNAILDIIINLVKGCKMEKSILLDESCGECLYACNYLLNQALRQYALPSERILVSEEANKLWLSLTKDKDIRTFSHRSAIMVESSVPVFVEKYKGASKTPYEIGEVKQGDTVIFNDVFTDEHVVPIKVIIKELIALPTLDYESVREVLSKMYICKVLKKEDHAIKKKSNRSLDYKEVIKTDYLSEGIKVVDFDYGEQA